MSLLRQKITTDLKIGRFLTYKKSINVMNVKPFFISKNQLKNRCDLEPMFSKHKIEPR